MHQSDINPDFSNLKITMPQIASSDILLFNYEASNAPQTYQTQSEAQKQLSPFRFWKKPNTLKERCLQMLAVKELETGKQCERPLPTELRRSVNDRLAAAERCMHSEKHSMESNYTIILGPWLLLKDPIRSIRHEANHLLRGFPFSPSK